MAIPFPPEAQSLNDPAVKAYFESLDSVVGNIFSSVQSDSGVANADSSTDTLGILGGNGLTTSIAADNLTINFDLTTLAEDTNPDVDNDILLTYDNSAGAVRKATLSSVVAGGSAVSTVSGTTSVTGVTFADTGLTVTITPRSANSKIVVMGMVTVGMTASAKAYLKLLRNSEDVFSGDLADSRTSVTAGGSCGAAEILTLPIHLMDSPESTDSLTYKIQFAAEDAGSTVYLNRSATDTDSAAFPRGISHLSVQEILS